MFRPEYRHLVAVGFPIRTSTANSAWKAAHRGLSQPPTSFIGFRRQGIHRWLFVAWKTKMLVLAMEFSRGPERRSTEIGQARHRGRQEAGRSGPALSVRLGPACGQIMRSRVQTDPHTYREMHPENGTEEARPCWLVRVRGRNLQRRHCPGRPSSQWSTGSG